MNKFMTGLAFSLCLTTLSAAGQSPDQLNDLEMAHVAVTASNIDISYAHLALAFSTNPAIRQFAETMIRDHGAVNQAVVDLAEKLGVSAQDNSMSRNLLEAAEQFKTKLAKLRGTAFDKMYAENELAYHETVNGIVKDSFIPNIENAEVKAAFSSALNVFEGHQKHASTLVREVESKSSK